MYNGIGQFLSNWLLSDKNALTEAARTTRVRALMASSISIPIYVAFAAMNEWVNDATTVAAASAIAAALSLIAILTIRLSTHSSIGGHCFTLALAVQVFGEMGFNGGLQAPAAALALLIVPAALFTGGATAVRPWAIITVIALSVIFILDLQGNLPANELAAGAQLIDRILSLAAGIIVVAVLIIQYERQATGAINKLVHERAEFKHRALHDSLTGMPNRSYFYEFAEQSIDKARSDRANRVLIYLDVDHFKTVNDQYGHDVGDALLVEFSSRLNDRVRPGDLAARLAGDEFAMIAELTERDPTIDHVMSRLQSITADPFKIDDQILDVGMSIGYAQYPGDGGDLETLLRFADAAMYADKSDRRKTA